MRALLSSRVLLTRFSRLRVKLKTISEQFDIRELHYKGLLRSKDSEIQSLTSKFEEQRRMAENETSRGRALSAQVSTFSHTEAELRSQLNIYVEKFKQVCQSETIAFSWY
jgi:hypothetical protein